MTLADDFAVNDRRCGAAAAKREIGVAAEDAGDI